MSFSLALHNVASIISAITALGITFFLILESRKTVNVTFALTVFFATVFLISHAVGVNISDPYISRSVFLFNLSTFFISAFNLHAVLAFTNKVNERRFLLNFVYGSAVFFVLFFAIFPDLLFLPSVPKMYFPSYYEPGLYSWVRLIFMYVIINPYIVYELWKAYRKNTGNIIGKRYLYFMIAVILSYSIAFIPNFLVYNIPIDPMWGMLFVVVFAIPFSYAVIKYEIFEIKVIAKQAFFYAVAVAIVGALITLFNYFSAEVSDHFPAFPPWIMPLISAVLVVTVSALVWRKLRETDLLKYEFITTVTHKFRTPLTHIKWASENLLQSNVPDECKEQLKYIENSNSKLVELTNLLMNVSDVEDNSFEYHMHKVNLSKLVEDVLMSSNKDTSGKHPRIHTNLAPNCYVNCDAPRITFIIQTFIENAINYSGELGEVVITVMSTGQDVLLSVRDHGIGVTTDEQPYMFTRFYRGKQARLTDTEGMGVALFISKGIIERHRGKIWMESQGRGKGSTFYFSLPEVH